MSNDSLYMKRQLPLFILPMRTKKINYTREGKNFIRSICSGFFVLRLMAQLPIPA